MATDNDRWVQKIAATLAGLSAEEIASMLEAYIEYQPCFEFPAGRWCGRLWFSQKELYDLAVRLDKYCIPEPNSGCWLWDTGCDWDGYGVTSAGPGKQIKAHRAAYLVYNGNIPISVSMCHSCDTPSCCNPDHLWVGTTAQNQQDSSRKLRKNGELIGTSKLTSAIVVKIRNDAAAGMRYPLIAEKYGLSRWTVPKVVRGETWAHIPVQWRSQNEQA